MNDARRLVAVIAAFSMLFSLSGCMSTAQLKEWTEKDKYWGGAYQVSPPSKKINASVYIDVQKTPDDWRESVQIYNDLMAKAVKKDMAAIFSNPSFTRTGREQFVMEVSNVGWRHLDFWDWYSDFKPTFTLIDAKSGQTLWSGTYHVKLEGPAIQKHVRRCISSARKDLIIAFSKPPLSQMLKSTAVVAAPAQKYAGVPVKVTRPEGIYRFDEDVTFNVLDSIAIDPAAGKLTLVGHYDPRYLGPRIPYLQHLKAFLDHPKPEFTLEWTPESEAKIDAFLSRMDDPSAMQAFGSSLGEWLAPDGSVNALGRQMLPLVGVTPTKNGAAPGYFGAQFIGTKDWYLDVGRVEPGSPAAQAGLLSGDSIETIDYTQFWHPSEVARHIRRTGAGGTIRVSASTPGLGLREMNVTLARASGDPWATVDRWDIFAALLEKSGNKKGARVLQGIARFDRIKDPDYQQLSMEELISVTDLYDDRERLSDRYNRGEISESEWRVLVLGLIAEAFEDAFRIPSGSLTSVLDRELNRGSSRGDAFAAVFKELRGRLLEIGIEALKTIMSRQDEVLIPASLAEGHLGIRPQVKLNYIGLASDTLLARAMFEADYLGKALIEMPKLSEYVPGYETQFVYYGNNPVKRNPMAQSISQRLWISIDEVPLVQSPDGRVLSIGDVAMRFNVAINSGAQQGESAGGYGELLTSIYDDLAAEFPVLHELREAAKMSSASQWLRARWPKFRLPANGQSRWEGPKIVDGVVYLMWDPKGSRVQIAAVGGVSMVPPIGPSGPVNEQTVSDAIPSDESVLDVVKSDPMVFPTTSDDTSVPYLGENRLTVVPASYNNTAMRRVLSRKTEVPVPRPPGWVVRATKGERTLKALNVVVPDESTACNPDTWMALDEKLDSVRMTARQLAGVESAINAITAQGPARQAEFAALERDLTQARQEFIDQSVGIVSQGLLDSRDMIRNRSAIVGLDSLGQSVEEMYEAREMMKGVDGKLKDMTLAWRTYSADDIESRNQAIKELTEYTRGLFVEAADWEGSDTLTRSFRIAGKTFKRLNKIKETLDYGSTLYTLGEAAQRMKTLGPQTEKENQALRDSLLPLQRKLSDQLDSQMKDPLVQSWMKDRAKVSCW